MNRDALILSFRIEAGDRAAGVFHEDTEILMWLREAEEEAAIRARLLFEDSAPMCLIGLAAGVQGYKLDPLWIVLTRATFTVDGSDRVRDILIRSRHALDNMHLDWRTNAQREPFAIVQDDTRILVAGAVTEASTLRVEGYRLPLEPLSAQDDVSPEIGAAHHRHLVNWALYRAYSTPDRELFNPDKAARSLAVFEQYFGIRPSANLMRDEHADQIHHTKSWFI